MTIDEGYIKFNCQWDQSDLKQNIIPKELMEHRDKLHEMSLIGVYDSGIGFGNISTRIPESSTFLISGSGTGGISNIKPNDFAFVYDYDVNNNTVWCKGGVKASSESLSHAAIYESNVEINSVIHVHDLNNWERLINILPTTDKLIPYGTPEMFYEIKNICINRQTREQGVLIMGGHEEGIIAFGENLITAYKNLLSIIH